MKIKMAWIQEHFYPWFSYSWLPVIWFVYLKVQRETESASIQNELSESEVRSETASQGHENFSTDYFWCSKFENETFESLYLIANKLQIIAKWRIFNILMLESEL